MEKICNRCGEPKEADQFHKRTASKDGLQSHCKDCGRTQQTEWRAANPERAREIVKKSHTPERRERYNQSRNATQRWDHIRRRYGVTQEEYQRRFEEQGGRCAICSIATDELQVDHCHETSVVRGLLCSSCNRAIGLLGDTLEALERAVAYLRRAEGEPNGRYAGATEVSGM
jgi:hypothetical protein